MIMEIYLNEEKAKQYNIDIEHCYDVIDRYFIEHGIQIISKGVYQGKQKDFHSFADAQIMLSRTNWFLKIIDQWYCRYLGDDIEYREDLVESYYRIEARTARYLKQQKST